MIFTGNFSNISKYVKAGYVPVSISLYPPKWYTGYQYKKLAPTYEMLRMAENKYREKYALLLSSLRKEKVLEEIRAFCMGANIVLLCFEKEGEFCHRRLVAEWLQQISGEIKELGDMKPQKKDNSTQIQLDLFS